MKRSCTSRVRTPHNQPTKANLYNADRVHRAELTPAFQIRARKGIARAAQPKQPRAEPPSVIAAQQANFKVPIITDPAELRELAIQHIIEEQASVYAVRHHEDPSNPSDETRKLAEHMIRHEPGNDFTERYPHWEVQFLIETAIVNANPVPRTEEAIHIVASRAARSAAILYPQLADLCYQAVQEHLSHHQAAFAQRHQTTMDQALMPPKYYNLTNLLWATPADAKAIIRKRRHNGRPQPQPTNVNNGKPT